jgi:hypothetical protein
MRRIPATSVFTTAGMTTTTRTCGALQRRSSTSASGKPLMAKFAGL